MSEKIGRFGDRSAEFKAVCEATGVEITHFPNNGVPEVYRPTERAIFQNFRPVVDLRRIGIDAIS